MLIGVLLLFVIAVAGIIIDFAAKQNGYIAIISVCVGFLVLAVMLVIDTIIKRSQAQKDAPGYIDAGSDPDSLFSRRGPAEDDGLSMPDEYPGFEEFDTSDPDNVAQLTPARKLAFGRQGRKLRADKERRDYGDDFQDDFDDFAPGSARFEEDPRFPGSEFGEGRFDNAPSYEGVPPYDGAQPNEGVIPNDGMPQYGDSFGAHGDNMYPAPVQPVPAEAPAQEQPVQDVTADQTPQEQAPAQPAEEPDYMRPVMKVDEPVQEEAPPTNPQALFARRHQNAAQTAQTAQPAEQPAAPQRTEPAASQQPAAQIMYSPAPYAPAQEAAAAAAQAAQAAAAAEAAAAAAAQQQYAQMVQQQPAASQPVIPAQVQVPGVSQSLESFYDTMDDEMLTYRDCVEVWAKDARPAMQKLISYVEGIEDKHTQLLFGREVEYVNAMLDRIASFTELQYIDELLDLKKYSFSSLVKECLKRLSPFMTEKRIGLLWKNLDVDVITDKRWFIFALTQIIFNAVEFTPQDGKIAISAKRGGEYVDLMIDDNGTGISQDDMPYIFVAGFMSDSAPNESGRRTGMGLFIARSVLNKMGGEVFAESIPGKSTRVTMRLPIEVKANG